MKRVLIAVSLFALTTFGSLSAQTPDQQQNTTAAGSSVSGISDSDFALEAAVASMAEVELGQLASQKAQSPEVKQFAQRMVTDHTQANDQLKQAAQGQNITIPTGMGAEKQQMKDRLSNLSGSEFDREYMRAMVHDHQEALSLFRQEASNGQGSLKSFAESMVPKLEEHYRMASDIASKLGISSSANTSDQGTSTTGTSGMTSSASSSTSPSSTDTSAQSPPRTDTDTAAPMVNNRTTEHGPEKDSSAAATSTTPPSDTPSMNSSSSSSSSTDTTGKNLSSDNSSSQTEPSTQSPSSSSTSRSSTTTSSSSTDNTTANTSTTQGTSTGSDQLPRTASPLPLIGLFGLMSLGTAVFLNLRRRLN